MNERAYLRTYWRIDERTEGRTNKRTDGRTVEGTNVRMRDERRNGRTKERTNERKERRTNGWTTVRTDGRASEQMNKETGAPKNSTKTCVDSESSGQKGCVRKPCKANWLWLSQTDVGYRKLTFVIVKIHLPHIHVLNTMDIMRGYSESMHVYMKPADRDTIIRVQNQRDYQGFTHGLDRV